MDGASLPSLMTPPGLAGSGLPHAATSAVDARRAGFAALLGATELAGLSAEQQAALRQLLADPAGTLAPVAEAAGKMSPPAAIVDLLSVLGVDLGRVVAGGREAATPGADGSAEAGGVVAGPVAALWKMLEALLPEEGQAAEPAEEDLADAGIGGLVLPLVAPGHPLPPGSAVADQTEPTRLSETPTADVEAPADPLRQLTRAVLPEGRKGEMAAPPTESHAPVRAVGPPVTLADAVAAAPGVQDSDPEVNRPQIGGDANAGIRAMLDAEGTLPGRAALAAALDSIPFRAAPPAGDGVAVPVGERGWERVFAERIVWLVSQQVQAAEVKLNPPHLGPVEVRLALNGQEANVSFTVAHGAVRDAVEQAIPRLREMFAEQNLQIVNVDVGQRDASSQASTGDRNGSAPASPGRAAVANGGVPDHAAPRRSDGGLSGLVDEYA